MINSFDKRIVTLIGFVLLTVAVAGYLQYSDTQNKEAALLADIKKTQEANVINERDSQRAYDMELITTALGLMVKEKGVYPDKISVLASYIELPEPVNNEPYLYELCPDGSVHLGVRLENEASPLLSKDRDEAPCSSNDFSGADPVYDRKFKP